MNRDNDLYGMIQEIVREEVMWYKHYAAQVLMNIDPDLLGRVMVSIPSLNITTPDEAFWAYPRDKQSMNVPAIDDWVEVYFLEANPDRPVYLGIAPELTQEIALDNFDGLPSTHVIFESPATGDAIVYDDLQKALDITALQLTIMDGTEPFVLGTQLVTYLTTMVTQINAALATKLDTSGSPGTLVPPVGITSLFIKGK